MKGFFMKINYRLLAGVILSVIFIGWMIFLISNEPDDTVSKEIRDKLEAQLNDTKQKVEKTVEVEAPTPTPTVTQEITDTPTATPEITVTPSPTPLVFPEYTKFDYIIANVEDSMNIREGAGQNKKVLGALPANGYGKIIERGTEWFKIKSGNVTGYVSTAYILTDTEAINKMRELNALKVKITADDVNIRKEPNTTCEVKLQAKKGTVYDYYPEFSTQLFYAVMVEDELCFVSNSYSEVDISLKTAIK